MICNKTKTCFALVAFSTVIIINNLVMFILFGTKTYWYYSKIVDVYDPETSKIQNLYLTDNYFMIHMTVTCILNFITAIIFMVFALLQKNRNEQLAHNDEIKQTNDLSFV